MEPVFCERAVDKVRAEKMMNSSKCFVNGAVNFLSISKVELLEWYVKNINVTFKTSRKIPKEDINHRVISISIVPLRAVCDQYDIFILRLHINGVVVWWCFSKGSSS